MNPSDALRDIVAAMRPPGTGLLAAVEGLPSTLALRVDAEVLARDAATGEAASIVPIHAPEVLMDGDHPLGRCAHATERVLHEVFDALHRHRVTLEHLVLEPRRGRGARRTWRKPSGRSRIGPRSPPSPRRAGTKRAWRRAECGRRDARPRPIGMLTGRGVGTLADTLADRRTDPPHQPCGAPRPARMIGAGLAGPPATVFSCGIRSRTLRAAMPHATHSALSASPGPVRPSRRRWLAGSAAAALGATATAHGPAAARSSAVLAAAGAAPPSAAPATRPIPSSGEPLPVVGLGTWITFNVGNDPAARDACAEVVRAFYADGGRVIDSSPMYGSSQPTIGHALAKLGHPPALFAAEKVWTGDAARGVAQMEASRAYWGVKRFDLMQVHNLLGWEAQLPRLLEMKAAGRLRYVGITTSEGRRHAEIEQVMRTQPIDFVQVSYNLLDRGIEQRILPLARERGIAVLVNRPFREGALLRALARHQLPAWAAEIDCDGWAQVALKFVVSHPAVTCAIPATRQVAHVRQNMGAARGRMPDPALRARMAAEVAAL